MRIRPEALADLQRLVGRHERPSMAALQRDLARRCARRGLRPPSRAFFYNALVRLEVHSYRISELPQAVRQSLYNLAPDATVPGRQLAFACFNYGSLAAVSFASGLPWLDLYQARRLRGWRPRSRGLIDAAMLARGIG